MNRKLALIIGNSHYQDPNLAKLVAPGEDVNDLAVVLRDPAIGGFEQVWTLIDETDAAIRLSIEDFFADKKSDDLLVLYFSGHGVRDEQGRLYLAAPNTRANRLRATAIAADFITNEMDRSRSRRQVLILDCCHSGAFAQGSKAVTGGTVGTGPAFEGTGYGRVVLTATDATQYAWEGDKIIGEADNSVFTHYLVQGLQTGEADVDADGRITLDELYDYVYAQVVARTPKQTPGKWSYKQQGDMIIARNPKPIVKPAELPADLRTAIESPLANVRAGAVRELDRLLNGSNAGLALAAFDAIKHLIDDDSRSVSQVASNALSAYAEKQRAREEQERLAKEQAEQERATKAKAEADRQTALKAERDRLAAERAEAERQAALKAEQDRIAAERAEAERQAAIKAEADRQAALKAEQDRIAAERAEADRQAAIKAEQDRIVAERVEAERQAALKAEADRQAALKVEQDRIAAERVEAERQAALKAEADRQAAIKAEQDRIAAEQVRLSEEILDTARRQAVSTAHLVVQSGPNAGQTFALQTGINIIGRTVRATVQLSDVLISRQHVRLNVAAGRVTLEDLGSANGTFVNAQRISGALPVTLNAGDTIAIGDTVLVLQTKADAPIVQPEEPHPGPLAIEQTFIAEASPPKSFADQLVADQPTRLSLGDTQLSTAFAARLKVIAVPTLIAAAGFGLSLVLWISAVKGASDLTPILVLSVVAIGLQWTAMGLALRQLRVPVSPQRLVAVAVGWGVAGGASVGTIYALVGFFNDIPASDVTGATVGAILGAVCGLVGGQITGRILRSPVPTLRLGATTWGWAFALTAGGGGLMSTVFGGSGEGLDSAFAVYGALIGAIGGGIMFWQIAQGHESAAPHRSVSTVVKSQAAPNSSATARLDLSSPMVRAIGIICGGWVLIELLVVLVGQTASSAEETATFLSLGLGVGSLGVGYVLQRAIPSMKRAAWWMAAIWSLALIGAIQIGVVTHVESSALNAVAVGVCGVVSAWAVLRDMPGVPRWQYGVIGAIWLVTYAIGSGYAWHMIAYKAQNNGWRMADTMNALGLDVFSLTLGAILSAVAGGVVLYRLLDRARETTINAAGDDRG